MSTEDNYIEIKFEKNGLYPEIIRARELAEVITSIEEMLTSLIELKPDSKSSNQPVTIGISSIHAGSIVLRFKSQTHPRELFSEYQRVTEAIGNNALDTLPYFCTEALKRVHDFAISKLGSTATFSSSNNEIPNVYFSSNSVLDFPSKKFIYGRTTIYGIILRIGGMNPRLALKTSLDNTIYSDITESLAKQLGERIYNWVGLSGNAVWEADSMNLHSFLPETIIDYQNTDLSKTYNELTLKFGGSIK